MNFLPLQQGLCCGVVFIALQFLVIGANLRGEKTIPFLGGAIILLCMMSGIDLWILAPALEHQTGEGGVLDIWMAVNQVIACFSAFLLLRFVVRLTGWPGSRAFRIHAAILAVWMALNLLDAVLPGVTMLGIRDGKWVMSPLYAWGFFPHMIGTFSWTIVRTFLRRRQEAREAWAILRHLCFGLAFLMLFGIVDFLAVLHPELIPFPVQTFYGVIVFNVACVFILADRLVNIYQDHGRALLETASVKGEMGRQRPLFEIGQSAAAVSDLIRSDILHLKDKVSALQAGSASGYQAEVARMEGARLKLERLTEGILDFSRSGDLGEREPVNPAAFIETCLGRHFPGKACSVRLLTRRPAEPIRVDASRLARALSELTANAFEAGASELEFRVRQGWGRTLIALDDDGEGMPAGRLADIALPFFTTRRPEGRLGLGAAIAGVIIRGHGGSLSYYRNYGRRGLTAVVVLPHQGWTPRNASPECFLASEDGSRIAEFVAACENLGVRPTVSVGPGRLSVKPLGKGMADANLGPGDACTEETLLELMLAESVAAGGR